MDRVTSVLRPESPPPAEHSTPNGQSDNDSPAKQSTKEAGRDPLTPKAIIDKTNQATKHVPLNSDAAGNTDMYFFDQIVRHVNTKIGFK